jgi:hypothetical protein
MEIDQARQLGAIALICINNAATAVRSSIPLTGCYEKKTQFNKKLWHITTPRCHLNRNLKETKVKLFP